MVTKFSNSKKSLLQTQVAFQVAYSVSCPVQWRAREWNSAADLLANVGFCFEGCKHSLHAQLVAMVKILQALQQIIVRTDIGFT